MSRRRASDQHQRFLQLATSTPKLWTTWILDTTSSLPTGFMLSLRRCERHLHCWRQTLPLRESCSSQVFSQRNPRHTFPEQHEVRRLHPQEIVPRMMCCLPAPPVVVWARLSPVAEVSTVPLLKSHRGSATNSSISPLPSEIRHVLLQLWCHWRLQLRVHCLWPVRRSTIRFFCCDIGTLSGFSTPPLNVTV